MTKLKRTALASLIMAVSLYQGCILEDFDTIPINIPVALPVLLADDGSLSGITSEAIFCLDSNEIYTDYTGKIKELRLVEVAFRFENAIPGGVAGDMSFVLKEGDITGNTLINHQVAGFTPGNYLIPQSPYIMDLSTNDLELMNRYLAANGTCFYGSVTIANLSPSGSPRYIKGYVDMLFKAVTEF